MLNFTENFPRYDKRFTEDLWAALRAEFHSRWHGCYNKLKLRLAPSLSRMGFDRVYPNKLDIPYQNPFERDL